MAWWFGQWLTLRWSCGLGRSVGGDDLTIGHADRALAAVSQRGIMRDENQRCAPAAMQVEQKIDDLIARFPVEIACRLVGENDQWVRRERSSNGHTLLFATRKLGREVAGPVTKSNLLQHRLRDCEGIAV